MIAFGGFYPALLATNAEKHFLKAGNDVKPMM